MMKWQSCKSLEIAVDNAADDDSDLLDSGAAISSSAALNSTLFVVYA